MNNKKRLAIVLIILALVATGLAVWLVNSKKEATQQEQTNQSIDEIKSEEQDINQKFESAFNETAKPEGWIEADCSVKDNSYSPGSYTITTKSFSPESDPAKDCSDYTNVFYVTYGVEMAELSCETPPQVKDFSAIDPSTDKSGCTSLDLGPKNYSRVVNTSRISKVEYSTKDDMQLSIKYYADDNGNLPYMNEVEKYISNINI